MSNHGLVCLLAFIVGFGGLPALNLLNFQRLSRKDPR